MNRFKINLKTNFIQNENMVRVPKRAFKLEHCVDPNMLEDDELKKVINEKIIDPLFEGKGVILTQYGNDSGRGSLKKETKMAGKKVEWESVENIRNAYTVVYEALIAPAEVRGGPKSRCSYGLKHCMENLVGGYISNGECIVAVILAGCHADFGETHKCGPFVNPDLYPCKFI